MAAPHPNAPVIGEIDDYAESGGTIGICFYSPTPVTSAFIQVGNDMRPVELRNVTAQTCHAIMPAGLTYGIWPLYLVNSAGISKPHLLNKPVAWWAGPDNYITRGDECSVFGTCLTKFASIGVTEQQDFARVVLTPKFGGVSVEAPVIAANIGRVKFIIPGGILNGVYKVRVHNGHGYKLADGTNHDVSWSKPVEITVSDAFVWNGPVIDVDSYAQAGDVSHQERIVRATNYAKTQNRATLKFNSPVYDCHIPFEVINNTRYLGNGKNNTIIQCRASGFSGNWLINAYFAGNTNVTFENIQPKSNGKIAQDLNLLFLRTCKNLRFINSFINAKGCQPYDLHHASHVIMKNTDIVGKIGYLGDAKQVFIEGHTYKGTNDTFTLHRSLGAQGVCITGGVWGHLDPAQTATEEFQGYGRCFVNDGTAGSARHLYIAGNSCKGFDSRPGALDRNVGEKILFEANQEMKHAIVISSTLTQTFMNMDSPKSLSTVGAIAKIVKGKGFGQTRWIKSFTSGPNGSFTVEEPWAIIPDNTSVISLGHAPDRICIGRNDLEGTTEAINNPAHVASEGVSFFGGCNNGFVWDNRFKARYGVRIWNTNHNAEGYPGNDATFKITLRNNNLTGCRWGLGLVLQSPTNTGPLYTDIPGLLMIRSIRDKINDAILDEIYRTGDFNRANAVRLLSFDGLQQEKLDVSLYYPHTGVTEVSYTDIKGKGK